MAEHTLHTWILKGECIATYIAPAKKKQKKENNLISTMSVLGDNILHTFYLQPVRHNRPANLSKGLLRRSRSFIQGHRSVSIESLYATLLVINTI